jgi:DNA modification methylase
MSEREVSREPMEAYIPPTDDEERVEALPQQEEFWRPPVRFGTIPVEKEPLGWDKRKGFYKLFPRVSLPFQIVERVSFGHPDLPANRLIWGDNLHVMRQLPSESIDLIYIDPPFFSGRQYNIIFGDQNEVRSFTDIWEGGMPGYLIWLNARLYEMKRLLKKTGSIYVHCDWHASHYIKVEMDKIFGYENFLNEVVWHYEGPQSPSPKRFATKHDTIFRYAKDKSRVKACELYYMQKIAASEANYQVDEQGRYFYTLPKGDYTEESIQELERQGRIYHTKSGKVRIKYFVERTPDGFFLRKKKLSDVWNDINSLGLAANLPEVIGYPTQKPEALVERIIKASTQEGDVVADFFCGGGTTPAVAQRLGRRWIACDQSRVAVAVTADRLIRGAQQLSMALQVPDFTVEYWGVYEARRLTQMPEGEFRPFILRCFGATPNTDPNEPGIHGYKGSVPVWVCPPDARYEVRHTDVVAFANADSPLDPLQAVRLARWSDVGLGVHARGARGCRAVASARGRRCELHSAGADTHRFAALSPACGVAQHQPRRLRELPDFYSAAACGGGLRARRVAHLPLRCERHGGGQPRREDYQCAVGLRLRRASVSQHAGVRAFEGVRACGLQVSPRGQVHDCLQGARRQRRRRHVGGGD